MQDIDLDQKRVRSLAAAIVLQAVRDWKDIVDCEISQRNTGIKQKYVPHIGTETYDSIRRFFSSEYGEALCQTMKIHPSIIVSQLEQYRLDALKADREGNYKKWRKENKKYG